MAAPGGREAKRAKIDADADEGPTEDDVALSALKVEREAGDSRHCPYLDTIKRPLLDFDFEKLCSVSLSDQNVYCCLVCGKYFQGRGRGTHAFTHSLDAAHHVFVNLSTLRFYCLPENYEVVDASLSDIKYQVSPTFTPAQIEALDNAKRPSRALDGHAYYPGVVGLNNVRANDYINVVMQALSHVKPLRNFFLQDDAPRTTPLLRATGELMRKLWNPRNFKAHVSPHVMLQAVSDASHRRFKVHEQGDPVAFLSWLLNQLHADLGQAKRPHASIVHDVFQGTMEATTRLLPPVDDERDADDATMADASRYEPQTQQLPYLYLSLPLPPAPLFRDEAERNFIPQVPLQQLLARYNGVAESDYKVKGDVFVKKFRLLSLPPYLILVVKRFTRNNFFVEKNRTVVNFPIRNLLLGELMPADAGAVPPYDLVANIHHEGRPEPGEGTYRCHVQHGGTREWFELQDLHVQSVLPPLIPLSETYIQIYERQDRQS